MTAAVFRRPGRSTSSLQKLDPGSASMKREHYQMPQFPTSYQRYGGRKRSLWVVCLTQRVICSSRQTGAGVVLVRVVMVSSPWSTAPLGNYCIKLWRELDAISNCSSFPKGFRAFADQ